MIDPRTHTWSMWSSLVNQSIASSAPPPMLPDEADWKRWAVIVLGIPAISSFSPPDPRAYDDWRTWAERFVECVLI